MISLRFFKSFIVVLLVFIFASYGKPVWSEATLPDNYVMKPPPVIEIPRDVPIKKTAEDISKEGIRIIAFGDSGTGDEAQMKVAAAMRDFCALNGCDLALMLGDNFHPKGIRSTDDPQLIEKFEKPYGAMGIPFFPILGEHDWGRNGEMYNWGAEIEYTKKSAFWRMPSDVYSIKVGNIGIFALNTNSIPISTAQVEWLKGELEHSDARWNLVMGHKPIYSYGYHGDIDFMIAGVLPVLCGRTDLYLSGHEHNEQLLAADCGLTLLVSSTAGKLRLNNPFGPRTLFAATEYGFSYLVVKDSELSIKIVSAEGKVLYEKTIFPRTGSK